MSIVRVPFWQKISAPAALKSFSIFVPAPENSTDVLYGVIAARYYRIATGASEWIAARGLRSFVVTKVDFNQNWSLLDPRDVICLPNVQSVLDSATWVLGAGDAQLLFLDRIGEVYSGDVFVCFQAPSVYNATFGWVVMGAVFFEVKDLI